MAKEKECAPTEIELFDEKANGIYGAFLESLQGDPKFVRPVEEDDMADEDWAFVYTDRAMRLIDRLHSRMMKIAEKKFGADAIDIDISSHLYLEY
jgi:hypothetical protein